MAGAIASASSVSWTTPLWLLELIWQVTLFIHLDPCSNPNSVVNAKETFTLPVDALEQDWSKYLSAFINPPFGSSYLTPDKTDCIGAKEYADMKKADSNSVIGYHKQVLKDWVAKSVKTYDAWSKIAKFKHFPNDQELYLLIPDQRSASHWHEFIFNNATAICTFRGRVAYDNGSGKKSSPSIGSALIYFGHQPGTFKDVFTKAGHHVELL